MCRRHRLPSVTTMSNTKNAVITGASRGLGLALARGLAADGWSLVIDARDADALRYAALCLPTGAAVTALPGDVADPAHRDALRRVADDLGGPGLPLHNPGPGGLRGRGPPRPAGARPRAPRGRGPPHAAPARGAGPGPRGGRGGGPGRALPPGGDPPGGGGPGPRPPHQTPPPRRTCADRRTP